MASDTTGCGGHLFMIWKANKNKKSQCQHLLAPFLIVSLLGSACSFKSHKEPPNTLHLSVPEKIKGLDPIYAEDLYSGTVLAQSYETLLGYHYLKRPYSLTPQLAEKMPEVSSDGLTYTFHLKEGVLFQDDPCFKATGGKGRELTAEDVLYSFKRLADPKLTSNGWWVFDDRIKGLNEWREASLKAGQSDYSKEIDGLKALDRYTVQIKLKKRSQLLLYVLAMPYTSIVPREAVEHYGREFINHAVGTGPFKLAEYNPNSKIIFKKNPTFRKELYPSEGEPEDQQQGLLVDAGKSLPLADQLNIEVYVEMQPMWLNFLSGKLDVSSIPKDNFSSAITSDRKLRPELVSQGIQLVKAPMLDITHASFNMADPLLGKNKYLRQALSLAYDENSFIDLFYNGAAVPAQGPIPPGLDGYNSQLKNPYRQFNIARAKELLAKAGYPEGKGLPPLEYASVASSLGRQQTEYLQKMFGAIGVKLNVNTYSWPQFLETVKNKRAQIWEYAWAGDYPDAENFLQLFYSKNASPGQNDSNYSNPEFDQLYVKSLDLPAGAERTALYQKMASMVIEDAPWIFGAHRMRFTLFQKWLKNYKPHEFAHGNFKYYRVDPNLKQ
jgi:oligopeptide transport system substrate-binding protein